MITRKPQYSAIIPVGVRVDEIGALIGEYLEALDSTGVSYEIVVVMDGRNREAAERLQPIIDSRPEIQVVELAKTFGESAALSAGFSVAKGELFLTLPAYYQVEAREIPKLVESAQQDLDMLIAVRSPRAGGLFDRLRRSLFHGLFKLISGMRFQDLGCGVRLLRREVVAEIALYADQHRFLPALASKRGFQVREVPLAQSHQDRFRGRYGPREYLHRLLDILTVFFLVRFTKKPLRFFGTIGVVAAGLGGLWVAILVAQRLFLSVGLADRPALLLASLLFVLGVQTFALGLVGELIIFTHASGMKEYAIRRVIKGGHLRDDAPAVVQGGAAAQGGG